MFKSQSSPIPPHPEYVTRSLGYVRTDITGPKNYDEVQAKRIALGLQPIHPQDIIAEDQPRAGIMPFSLENGEIQDRGALVDCPDEWARTDREREARRIAKVEADIEQTVIQIMLGKRHGK